MEWIGHPVDSLPLRERVKLNGKWIALEIYTPETLPLRLIEAVGVSTAECVTQLRNRGLDPSRYEFTLITPPY